MSDLIESARKAVQRYDEAAPASARNHACALECVGLLRLMVEREGERRQAVRASRDAFSSTIRAALTAEEQREGMRRMWEWPWGEK